MSQDVNEDWGNRDFIESVEVCVRKCVDFLNHFHESAQYRLSVVDQRLTSLERKLDFLEAQLLNCDPSQREAQQKPFTGSIFDPAKRAQIVQQNLDRRKQPQKYTKQAIAPRNLKLAAQQRREELLQQQEMERKRAAQRAAQQKAAEEEAKRQAAEDQARRQREAREAAERKKAEAIAAQRAKEEEAARQKAAAQAQAEQQRAAAAAAAAGPPPSPAAGRPPPSPVAAQQQPPPSPAPAQRPPPQPIPAQQPPPQPNPNPKPPQAPGYGGEGQMEGEGEGEGEGGMFPHGDPSRIDIQTIVQGSGRTPTPTSSVEIQYNGFLPNGKQFIAHQEVIQLGRKQNIKGLEMACTSMNEGTRAKLWIPFKLAYGTRGAGSLIPPNSDLTFDITLIRVVEM